jgi:hypothetical protein
MDKNLFLIVFVLYMLISLPIYLFFMKARDYYRMQTKQEVTPIGPMTSFFFSLIAFIWPISITYFVVTYITKVVMLYYKTKKDKHDD